MAMEINGRYDSSKTDYAEQVKEKQASQRAEKAKETDKKLSGVKGSNKGAEPHDEYVSSEKSAEKPVGLYRVEKDGDGNRKIVFYDPKKSDNVKGKEAAKESGDKDNANQADQKEKCTTDTGRVDREIRKLREKEQQIKQQLKSAGKDPQKVRELEKKLARLQSELSQKDNDTYRRQNASVS
ncbi:MAG: hypothetical protein K2N63_03915 [Lachnospiraceae bacterium]|nr:hypothetical protein [Lachnospiraceae bacterium]